MLQDIQIDHFAENEYFSECCIKIYFIFVYSKEDNFLCVWMDIFLLNLANWETHFQLN